VYRQFTRSAAYAIAQPKAPHPGVLPPRAAPARGPKLDLKCGSSMVVGVRVRSLRGGARCLPVPGTNAGGLSLSEARGRAAIACASGWAVSEAQYDQHNNCDPDYQCRKRYGIMI
jgi:hypothetical protein